MDFIPSDPGYDSDAFAKDVWAKLEPVLRSRDGFCYYRYPVIKSSSLEPADFTLLAAGFQPTAISYVEFGPNELSSISEREWTVNGEVISSPLLDLEDYLEGVRYKFSRERRLRKLFDPIAILVFPLVTNEKIASLGLSGDEHLRLVGQNGDLVQALEEMDAPPSGEWRYAKSILQGVRPLTRDDFIADQSADTIGAAIEQLDRRIALLDHEQHKVATQLAPGPQRIRGLAGTGKTVVLAMKAANIHSRLSNARVLYTFNTQSLYNQARTLITKFYRESSIEDPDWDLVQVLHAWGGKSMSGVYYETCLRTGVEPMPFGKARAQAGRRAFAFACEQLLSLDIEPIYDFVLVDEAQDFPAAFCQLLARLTKTVGGYKRIYFAYDELQSLQETQIRDPEDWFGRDDEGTPYVTITGDPYGGGIEKDFILHRSYRCPRQVLMLAHAIGLGIHGPRGCVQMLEEEASWNSIGYQVEEGSLVEGANVKICRDRENSPNPIEEIYKGDNSLVEVQQFDSREAEVTWVAEKIQEDVKKEGVRPEDIVVITLNSRRAAEILTAVQKRLFKSRIQSTIPGVMDESSAFAESGRVTLTSVHRAKGNEAAVVYIMSFQQLGLFAEEIESRNRAFTAISRSKGWVRISGVNDARRLMTTAADEIDRILRDMPCLSFVFPSMESIRRLDAESTRRRREVSKVKNFLSKLKESDVAALADIHPDLKEEVIRLLRGSLEDDDIE